MDIFDRNGNFIVTVPASAELSDIIKHNGVYWSICSINASKDIANAERLDGFTENLEEIDEKANYDCYGESDLVCPVCGYVEDDSPHESGTTYCANCGAELEVEVEYRVSYYPKLKQMPNILEV